MLWVNWISQRTYLFSFLDLENIALLWDIFAMKPIYFHAYLKSYPTSHFPVEMPQSSRKKQVQRDELIFFLVWLWLQKDLAGFHMHQRAYFPKVGGHIHSGHTSHILSGKPQCWSIKLCFVFFFFFWNHLQGTDAHFLPTTCSVQSPQVGKCSYESITFRAWKVSTLKDERGLMHPKPLSV